MEVFLVISVQFGSDLKWEPTKSKQYFQVETTVYASLNNWILVEYILTSRNIQLLYDLNFMFLLMVLTTKKEVRR